MLSTMDEGNGPMVGIWPRHWPVGMKEIAEALDARLGTVVSWRARSRNEWAGKRTVSFPEPRGNLSGRDWWWWGDIVDWLDATDRSDKIRPSR